MLASISPFGERARGNRWGRTATAFTVGSLTAAAALGLGLGALGATLRLTAENRWAMLALAAAAAAIVDVSGRVPTGRRQVDERWLTRYRGWVYGAGFGAQLGVGVATVVPSATVYAWLLGCALTAAPWSGAVGGAAFGLVRSAPLLVVARDRTPVALRSSLRTVAELAGPARLAAAGGSVAVAIAAALRA